MRIEKTLEWLRNCQHAQLDQKLIKKIDEKRQILENTQFDSTGLKMKELQLIDRALEICESLLKDAIAYKVEYRIGKNCRGYFENSGTSYFWTHEEAEDFRRGFMEKESGWTSEIDEPEEIPLDEAELD